MGRQEPDDRERVAGGLEGDDVVGPEPAGERLDLGRCGADPAGGPDSSRLGDRDLAGAKDARPIERMAAPLERLEARRANDTWIRASGTGQSPGAAN
jgi:hypothetical protein